MKKITDYFYNYPLTFCLIGMNTIMFIFAFNHGGVTNPVTLTKLGALTKETMDQGEYYRLISSMFLHYGWIHFLANMHALKSIGHFLESSLGKRKFGTLYLISGVIGNIATYGLMNGNTIALGASGAIFGLFGCLLGLTFFQPSRFGHVRNQTIKLVLINVIITLLIPFLSKGAHFGGLLTGIVFSIYFSILYYVGNWIGKKRRYTY